jgi:hypothetical protein
MEGSQIRKGESVMPSSSAVKAKIKFPGKSVNIKIHDQFPDPRGEVLVLAGGKVNFKNEDGKEYRVLVWRKRTEEKFGIEFVLAGHASVTLAALPDEELHYKVLDKSGTMATGHGGGPIKSVIETIETGHGGGPIK